ncbi:MAG: DUF4136 domain-containing protein [Helicobacteraceae bacterium]|nr:DUF4136 domain-containing protein [Helicobacteraceae bacterium]
MYKYLLPFLLLLFVGCASKVKTDYDPMFKTGSLSTFAVVHTSKEGIETLNDERIREAITGVMQQKGYKSALQDTADFHITYKSALVEDVPSNFSFGFGVGTYSSGVGTSVGTTHNVSDDQEHLDINMVDPKTKKTFWRASVAKKYRNFKSPEERSDYFDKTVASMLTAFPARNITEKNRL